MACFDPEPIYANPPFRGIALAASRGDGNTIDFLWYKAIPPTNTYNVGYNFYFSNIKNNIFKEGVKYVVTNPNQLEGHLTGFTPGELYYFAVRGFLYDPTLVDLSLLPNAVNGSKIYPETALTSDITDTDTIIPILDAEIFPPYGILQIGQELIRYSNVDIGNNTIIASERGLYNTDPRLHTTDGYDGVRYYDDTFVRFFKGFEDKNTATVLEENKFDYPNYPRTDNDGYREKEDNLTTDLVPTEEDQEDFPEYDYAGWHRTDPVDLLAGKCLGSYIGGEYYCADGYLGIGRQIRGIPIDDHNNQREEVLLNTTGESVVLFRKVWKAITSNQYTSTKETPEYRALDSFGVDTVLGYEQYFNHRRSDRRIMVRIEAAVDDLVPQEDGLEPSYKPNCWTLSTPAIKDRDFFIRFNKDGTEEFRYMILNVTRNKIFLDNYGRQQFAVMRMPKTDPIYQVRYLSDASTIPQELATSISQVPGPGGILPHSHNIVISENITTLNQINQLTSVVRAHNHEVINGVVMPALGHTHDIII